MTFSTTSAAFAESIVLDVEVAIVGGGPAGLMAAEVLSQAGVSVHLFDAMPSVGRKFLLAGKGGLNLTHSEVPEAFVTRYGPRQQEVASWLEKMDAQAVRDWAQGLGIETFVGSSGRVFPQEMKAAPLLRAWLHRLRQPASGVPVQFHMRHRWQGWAGDHLVFERTGLAGGACRVRARATVLALGGASWPRLGSDGAWAPMLAQQGIVMAPWRPANCGFDVMGRDGRGWTDHFRTRFAGHPLKSVALRVNRDAGDDLPRFERQGEFVITEGGVEGSLIYAASALLRDDLERGDAALVLDLLPGKSSEQVLKEVCWPRGSRSLSSHLKSRLGIDGVKMGLVHELNSSQTLANPEALALQLKNLSVSLKNPRPVSEAISSAGGVVLDGLTQDLMLSARPGVYCAGEMLDWEAPTGGYLLTACLASGWRAGQGVLLNF
ncbi:aminoacetone oxidase family FAD-binding enzyme [Limnohabitans sp. T6-5]|uniref:TIGR03862 family flavoprotein n=1 Tax=Limnohabitans sp. T6-5 TaxID=1100724 RepID=UPI000D3AA994|nr:TIGR03862 family flavoprotein [Limnohabitans sp. T6-5]PUE06952.1 aminoacetone oxidase family FAD-binding enzyme [Limnohabitans sp. T6-5]